MPNSLFAHFIGVGLKHHGDVFDDFGDHGDAEGPIEEFHELIADGITPFNSAAFDSPVVERQPRARAGHPTRATRERGGQRMNAPARGVVPPPKHQVGLTPKASGTMRLDKLIRGKQSEPRRILLAGVEGIGKSTFAASAPSPIFLGAEDGTAQLDVARFPTPNNWADMLDAIGELTNSEHDFRTLVLDTLDWAEPLVWAFICARDRKSNIEAYGYGKGYNAAFDEWRIFLRALEVLRRTKRMEVILLAHTHTKTFKNPSGEDFDRYELKLHLKAAGLLKEWCDAVLFASYEDYAVKREDGGKAKGFSTGARLLHTERAAAYDAKNRYGLPPQLALSWEEFDAACKAAGDPPQLQAAIRAKAAQLGGELEAATLASLERAGSDASKLSVLLNWCVSKLSTQTNTETEEQ